MKARACARRGLNWDLQRGMESTNKRGMKRGLGLSSVQRADSKGINQFWLIVESNHKGAKKKHGAEHQHYMTNFRIYARMVTDRVRVKYDNLRPVSIFHLRPMFVAILIEYFILHIKEFCNLFKEFKIK